MKTSTLFLTVLMNAFSTLVFAQHAGDLDNTFDTDGKQIIGLSQDDEGHAIAIQADGKLVVAGSSDNRMVILRFNTDGSLDSTFGGDGSVTAATLDYSAAYAVLVQSDGKIVGAGEKGNDDFMLARFLSDGTPDSTFGTDGITVLVFDTLGAGIHGIVQQADGKLVATGFATNFNTYEMFAIARFKTNGTPDSTFSADGRATLGVGTWSRATSAAIQPDGRIIAGGYADEHFALLRYNTDGSLDNTFSGDGIVTTNVSASHDASYAIALQPNGKIVVAGEAFHLSYIDFALVRYNTDGNLDTTFSGDGKEVVHFSGSESYAYGIAIQADGKIIVGGSNTDVWPNAEFMLARYNANGTPDSTFGTGAVVYTQLSGWDAITAILLQPDGKLVATGLTGDTVSTNGFGIARYLAASNTGLTETSPVQSISIYPNPMQQNVMVEYTLTQNENLTITLSDLTGRLLKTFITNEPRTGGQHKELLSLNKDLAPGNYILTISSPEGSRSTQLTR